MYNFGSRSQKQLSTLHEDLQIILRHVIQLYDFSILEGMRTQERQQELFNATPPRTKLDGVIKKSKHQGKGDSRGYIVSYAVDIMPYKKGTNAFSGEDKDTTRFYYLAGLMKGVAERLLTDGKIKHKLRWGGDWNGNDIYTDQNFDDLPHFELIKA